MKYCLLFNLFYRTHCTKDSIKPQLQSSKQRIFLRGKSSELKILS